MLAQKAEGFLVDFQLFRECPVAVEISFALRPLRKQLRMPEFHRIVDVVEDRELAFLGVIEHQIIGRIIQPAIQALADPRFAVEHFDAVIAHLVEHLDLSAEVFRIRQLHGIIVK